MDFFNSPEFTKRVNELIQEWHVPGIAIGVVHNETVASHGYGNAIIHEENSEPVTGDTVFDIASSSKSLTAAAVAILVADDENHPEVQWETPVSKLLPEDFVMSDESYTNGTTVEDILSHRTGLPGHDFSYLSPRAKHPDTLQSVTRNLRNLELSAPIRAKYMYCNMMYSVAAYLVEHISGLSFEQFVRRHIWQPLGMTATNIQSKNAIKAGLPVVQPYKWNKEDRTYTPVERQDSPEAVGAGLVVTSVNDYIKWVKALLYQEPPVSEEIFKALTKPRGFEQLENLDPLTSPSLYGAGLWSRYYRGHLIVCHDGLDPGIISTHFFLPQFQFGVVIFANSAETGSVIQVIARELIDEALDVPKVERTDWNAWQHALIAQDEREEEEEKRKVRKELCPESDGQAQPQQTPLATYTGLYWNAGYHGMKVEVNEDQKLFIDASDRTMGFTLTFEHLCNEMKFIAHFSDYYEGSKLELAAEFEFEEDRVVRMGLDLEEDLVGRRVWFERVREAH